MNSDTIFGLQSGLEFGFQEMPVGGAALDLTGVPLPEETLSVAKASDAVLLGAIGGYLSDYGNLPSSSLFGLLVTTFATKLPYFYTNRCLRCKAFIYIFPFALQI